MPSLRLAPQDFRNVSKGILAQLRNHPRFKTMTIGFNRPYDEIAFYLENGTGPATKKEGPRADGRTAKGRIGMWTEKQYPDLDGERLDVKKNEMYKRIMATGTPPHPFIVPAFEDTFKSGEARSILEKGGSTRDVAEAVVTKMMFILVNDNHVKYSDDVRSILDSIYIVEGETKEMSYTPSEMFKDWKNLQATNRARHQSLLSEYYNNLRSKK